MHLFPDVNPTLELVLALAAEEEDIIFVVFLLLYYLMFTLSDAQLG